jgi:hypothetical protein
MGALTELEYGVAPMQLTLVAVLRYINRFSLRRIRQLPRIPRKSKRYKRHDHRDGRTSHPSPNDKVCLPISKRGMIRGHEVSACLLRQVHWPSF